MPEDELSERRGDPKLASWSSSETLLAVLIDEVRHLTWVYAQSQTKQKVPFPEPLERPGVRSGRRKKMHSAAELKMLDPRLRGLSDEDAIAKYKELTGRG